MTINNPFSIYFSGITVRFLPTAPLELPEEFEALLCEDTKAPNAQYEIQLLNHPLTPVGTAFHNQQGTLIYRTEEGWLRISPLMRDDKGCQVACLLSANNRHILYYPAALWQHYSTPLHCAHLIGIETLLLQNDAFLIHSSVVMLNEKAVLFVGPSGIGKSTQADLWRRHLGADILNGDRCVVMKKDGVFFGGGSPLAGHSLIYRREQAPIAGIILLRQAQQNSIRRLGFRAFSPLFSQTLVNSWDADFMDRIMVLFQDLLDTVPIYELSCLPNEEAVDVAYKAIY